MKNTPTNSYQLMITEEDILKKISSLAEDLNEKYHDKQLVIVMILKGSICFVADLIRRLKIPFVLEAIRCESYGLKGVERGALTISGLDLIDFKDKYVLVVDDIFDSGYTLHSVLEQIQLQKPKSLISAVLLAKNVDRHVLAKPDYVLFNIKNEFVIGYGLDFKELYRGLPVRIYL
ncbi:MAG: hypoxanthine phosphoribosyltransferase [Chlamydiae bacterium]|nr:hypoxanthine phosphoribosyltransferase [Chlamydiota bacterium]